jgi:hypothetical protein
MIGLMPAPVQQGGTMIPFPPGEAQGGSRRRRRHKKSNSALTSLMNMMGMKTKKRRHRGGNEPYQGFKYLDGANFPSAANAQGNNIYDISTFNPTKAFTGGKTRCHKKSHKNCKHSRGGKSKKSGW